MKTALITAPAHVKPSLMQPCGKANSCNIFLTFVSFSVYAYVMINEIRNKCSLTAARQVRWKSEFLSIFVTVSLIWLISIQVTFAQGRFSAIVKFTKGLAPWAAAGAGVGVAAELARKYDANTSPGEAIYSLMFDMNSNASALKWADVFSKPDIFAVVQVEGVGEYLIPHIINEYAGQRVIWTFKMPAIPKNRNVVVHIYDDDSTSDQIWNNILKTRWSVTVDGTVIYGVAKASVSANGQVQLLNQKVTIDASDYICGFALNVPSSFISNEWTSDGDLVNSEGTKVGKIGVSQKYVRSQANSATTQPKKKWYELW